MQPSAAATRRNRYPPSPGTCVSRTLIRLAVLGVALAPAAPLAAVSLVPQSIHPSPPPETRAVPLEGAIRLDGRLDEAVWQTAPPATDFRQAQPHEGQPATQRTEVRFATRPRPTG